MVDIDASGKRDSSFELFGLLRVVYLLNLQLAEFTSASMNSSPFEQIVAMSSPGLHSSITKASALSATSEAALYLSRIEASSIKVLLKSSSVSALGSIANL